MHRNGKHGTSLALPTPHIIFWRRDGEDEDGLMEGVSPRKDLQKYLLSRFNNPEMGAVILLTCHDLRVLLFRLTWTKGFHSYNSPDTPPPTTVRWSCIASTLDGLIQPVRITSYSTSYIYVY